MSPMLIVETSDLAAAAHQLADRVGEPLWSRVGAALAEAMTCTGMAGDDPTGLSWAASYESGASSAAQAAQDVINGAFRLATLLGATAANYATADAASTIGERHAVDDVVTALPSPTEITLGTRFAGVGGGPPNAPFGWSHVEHLVREVWPNGHQDRLRRAAAAWRRSAESLSSHADDVDLALLAPLEDGLPEWPDIRTACWSLTGHIHTVARAHHSIAHACDQFAHHLDVAHSKIEHEIALFLAESAALQAAGDVLSCFSFGLAEAPTQAEQAAKIVATVARITAILTEFAADVREVLLALPLVAEISTRVSSALHDLLSVRVVSVEVAGVPGLRVLSLARDGRSVSAAADASGELGAVTRLTEDADLPAALRAALDSPRSGEWNASKTFPRHYDDHASDFGPISREEYERRAAEFLERGLRNKVEVKIDPKSGDILMYDPGTNTFGCYTRSGTVRTFFKPGEPGYFDIQRGVRVRW